MDIIVLCGGLSTERDVSLVTGQLVTAALRRLGHRAVAVDVSFGYPGTYSDPKEVFSAPWDGTAARIGEAAPNIDALKKSGGRSQIGDGVMALCLAADLVFMALHGDIGENGKLQACFDLLGIKYTGCSCEGSMLAMDKSLSKELFRQNGIPTPEGIVVRKGGPRTCPCLPCVVKPMSGGSSVGTSIANTMDEYEAALDLAFRFDPCAIAERYIRGRECDVGVIAGHALPIIEICPKSGFYDYKNKYQNGMTDEYCPADLPEEITKRLQQVAVEVFRVLRLEVYARMDFMLDEYGSIWCLEANTLPGLTNLSLLPQEAAAEGVGYDELIEIILSESLKKYGETV